MPKLAGLFVGGASSDGGRGGDQPDPVDAALREALAKARDAWPDLVVAPAEFVAHVGRLVPRDANPVEALAEMHVADLYLARACLDSVPGAATAFEKRYRPVVSKYLARLGSPKDVVAEICQDLFARLLTASSGKPAGLAEYEGRSALAHWIGISAQRLALNEGRAARTRRRLVDRLVDEPPPSSAALNPERDLLRRQYRIPLEAALHDAVSHLTGRDRVIMRLNLVGRVSTVRIAKMYQVNQATVSRWLARARKAIWSEVEVRLRAELRLTAADLDSVLRSVASEIDVSLSSALASEEST